MKAQRIGLFRFLFCVPGACLLVGTSWGCSSSSSDDGGHVVPGFDGGVTDAPVPDAPVSDAPVSDAPVSDAPVPDAPVADAPVADAPVPDAQWTAPGTWVSIAKGTFIMGSPTSELCREINEEQHQVTLTRDFEISAYEVTQGEFQSLMGYNPSSFKSCGTDCPVESVSWHEAAAYCNALSEKAGKSPCYTCTGTMASVTCSEASAYSGKEVYNCPGYRLPTEAEWEYAYRADTTTAFYNGATTSCLEDANADKIGWYASNSANTTHPVGQKQANAWGLFDMAGNVFERCHDRYQSSLGSSPVTDPVGSGSGARVSRGGAWGNTASDLRAASRLDNEPTVRHDGLGFRCARTK